MKIQEVSTLSDSQKTAIVALWNQEYPIQVHYQNESEFDQYLNNLSDIKHFLLYPEANKLRGWAITFLRDNERWFAIIIDTEIHSRGYGRSLLSKLKKDNTVLNGWVVNENQYKKSDGTVYQSPLPFYLKNGFELLPSESIDKKISAIKIRWTQSDPENHRSP
ncbi:hypothetical protein BFP97_08225 [Roseivirga sp. 4D4]|uniref:GNAT family N-acetyltransferase n=1 Tax=Roseivirga sp. 4D4 TaxID=1889784 RepID=UPI000852FD75|nr:GNAT family N-acetyltransferase [Roseivirga sp. 4D4]OEK01508.1 hypothetical protein BFP97_08225 [Roseivirga sp. 4D4]